MVAMEIEFIKILEFKQAKTKNKVWLYNKRWNEKIEIPLDHLEAQKMATLS